MSFVLAILAIFAQAQEIPSSVPVRGFHCGAPARKDLEGFLRFVQGGLAREGVNTLILEFGTGYNFSSRPEFAQPSALGKEEVARIASTCRALGIALIPQINCLGHQSWAKRNGAFLTQHPEFDETPGKFPENQGLYCRSYCPLHPGVHEVLFSLIDELARACEAKAFHAGLDEVFILGDPDCPRCGGKDPAELFAGEVRRLHDHLALVGCRMWMWGDRFLDGQATGIGKWEASQNGTAPALDRVPKDIVICDWHYDRAHETPRYFAQKGFDVVACPWRKPAVALGQLALVRELRSGPAREIGAHALGVVQTTWCGWSPFAEAYTREDPRAAGNPAEAARTFRALMKALRERP